MNACQLSLSPTEAEALILFLAERLPLWRTHADACGVETPEELPQRIVAAHRAELREREGK